MLFLLALSLSLLFSRGAMAPAMLFLLALSLSPRASGDLVRVDFYGEALCPYCANLTQQVLKPLHDSGLMAKLANLTYVPWGNARYNSTSDSISCQHGPRECELNAVLSCAIHQHPSTYFEFVECLEVAAFQEHDTAALVGKCAAAAGYAASDVLACAQGDLGQQLQRSAMKQTQALHPPHAYVPWVVVNGIPLRDDYINLATYLCAASRQEPRPDACYDLPSPSLSSALPATPPESAVAPAVLTT